MAAVEVKNLTFSYDGRTNAVEDVTFRVEPGAYCTIVGRNGSGKSTVAKLIAGLLDRKSGDILIEGIPLQKSDLLELRSRIGIVFQNPDNQFIGSTVRDDIAFGLENHCVPQEEMDGIIERFASEVGMSRYLDSEPARLSGGQKQRVAIAGVLAMHPDILIFDEATSMLDPQGKDRIKQVIRDLHKDHALTILSITHDIEEVGMSDQVVLLDQGKLVMSDTPDAVFSSEERIRRTGLDVPFSLKLVKELRHYGVKMDPVLQTEMLVEELCRLRLKK
ncbi:MAG: energy-coupling factor transporter ATPase [Erysipelotrichaceae bacterium]|nr:energy-coupling factor transporter ATPase [Erysipelotrichaceae bacterium]